MTPIDTTPTKSELLLQLATTAYLSNPDDADAQQSLRLGFEAVIAALRQVDGIPAADIDQFVKDAQNGAGVEALMVPTVLFATMLPDVDFYTALIAAGFGEEPFSPTPWPPDFMEAGDALTKLREVHGDAALNMPEHDALWEQLLKFAPPEFMQTMREGAKRFGLLPETKYVNDAGEPVFSAEQIAEKLGMPVADVEMELRERFADKLEIGNVYPVQ